jgi:hypothetical protein
MTDLLDTPPNTPDELPNDDSMLLADYAQRAYLEYALSMVKSQCSAEFYTAWRVWV